MKHLIIGSGVVGSSTGIFLDSFDEEVIFFDKNSKVLTRLKNKKFKTCKKISDDISSCDMIWVCTSEWDVEDVIKDLPSVTGLTIVVIRATMPPGDTKRICDEMNIKNYAHIPEFLREKTHIEDVFNPDRIIVGVSNRFVYEALDMFFRALFPGIPIVMVSPVVSELIKLVSNCWLATQVCYWNEILKLCKEFDVAPQLVANGCTLDKRISKYGSKMIGDKFSGFCLPKDLNTLLNAFAVKKTDASLLKCIKELNEG